MGSEHSTYCRKEKEIATIHEKVNRMEKEVVGNGEGLVKTVPILAANVGRLEVTTANLDRNLDKVVKILDQKQGEQEGKAEMRRRTRAMVAAFITITVFLAGALITTIHLLVKAGGG